MPYLLAEWHSISRLFLRKLRLSTPSLLQQPAMQLRNNIKTWGIYIGMLLHVFGHILSQVLYEVSVLVSHHTAPYRLNLSRFPQLAFFLPLPSLSRLLLFLRKILHRYHNLQFPYASPIIQVQALARRV